MARTLVGAKGVVPASCLLIQFCFLCLVAGPKPGFKRAKPGPKPGAKRGRKPAADAAPAAAAATAAAAAGAAAAAAVSPAVRVAPGVKKAVMKRTPAKPAKRTMQVIDCLMGLSCCLVERVCGGGWGWGGGGSRRTGGLNLQLCVSN